MCRRDEAVREARDAERQLAGYQASERIAARVEACNRLLPAEELERIRNRVELGAEIPEDCGRLLEHVAVLEAQCGVTQFELSVEKWMCSTYKLQLETIESAAWFRLGRRLFGFRSLGPLPPFPPKA